MPIGHYLISEGRIVEKHRKIRPISKQMFQFSESALIYTEAESFTHYVDATYKHNNNT